MRTDTWERLDADYAETPKLKAEPVPLEEVDAASAELGLRFPEDYRQFIQRYGSALVGAYSIFGLRQAEYVGTPWSVIEETRQFQEYAVDYGWEGVDGWVVISMDAFGNWIGIAPNGHVLLYDYDLNTGIEHLGNSFEEFIRRECLELND